MIALPVAAVTAADVARATQDITGTEALERRTGAGDALVTAVGGGPLLQAPDPNEFAASEAELTGGPVDTAAAPPTAADVRAVLGERTRLLEVRRGAVVSVATDAGFDDAELLEVDLTDPLAAGLVELTSGRLPEGPGEVVVNAALAESGPGLLDTLRLRDGPSRAVVGTVESTEQTGYPLVAGPVGVGDGATDRVATTWIAETGPDGVSWEQVRALNAIGATAVSRVVLEDPPPLPPEVAELMAGSGPDEGLVAAAVLVVTMALMEVVLLAGPAFAVSARRQSRTLALVAAAGGTPRQGRRIVLASGLVLGGLAAALGTVVGLAAGWGVLPLLQLFSDSRFGPFDVPWSHLPVIAGFGLLSAFLAAVVPAVVASRQDVVAVLAGRRGDRRPSRRSPVLGLGLVAVGVALAAYGAGRASGGETLIAGSAILTVAGTVLLVPLVVAGVARVGRRAPLSLRYAVRDAARHRTRTAPAVAAVAATVAGVVALGIATSSDEAGNEQGYEAQLPMGWGLVSGSEVDAEGWAAAATAVLPGAEVAVVRGPVADDEEAGTYASVEVVPPGDRAGGSSTLFPNGWNSSLGTDWLVAAEVPDALAVLVDAGAATRAEADAALAAGGAVLLSEGDLSAGVELGVERYDLDTGEPLGQRVAERVEAAALPAGGGTYPPVAGVLSPAAARAVGLEVAPRAVLVSGAEISARAAEELDQAVAVTGRDGYLYVERGYVAPDETVVVQLVLFGLGAVLMLGGTLTATFLALADARPDLATLAAVGASPRRRRGVAAAYALVVGGTGAALGAAVGFVPGVAVSFPLTRGFAGDGVAARHVLDVPWTLIGLLVVALPLLVAALVWLTARSRLPLAARLD
ncbi:FtsX-like permease family protein [Nocardioides perillae]|uniref:Putative ABC transport system permease protein n=1 Tax=Nocardioides perillae TaxID=1119534 RepID=A0A7Y9RPA1_9ACTN|nr:FtsX-like permease family protein [Nocardioides perillae]NYG54052.1 putative ABC transport system permease protein [Nocardioides perillae]